MFKIFPVNRRGFIFVIYGNIVDFRGIENYEVTLFCHSSSVFEAADE